MRREFSMKTVVRQTDNVQLKELLDFFQVDHSTIDWESLGKRENQPIIDLYESLEDRKKDELHDVFFKVAELACSAGMLAIAEAGENTKDEEWKELMCDEKSTFYTKAMITRIRHADVFNRAFRTKRISEISWAKRRIGLPITKPRHLNAEEHRWLEEEVQNLYEERENRGKCSTLEVFECKGVYYYFIYPDDYPMPVRFHTPEREVQTKSVSHVFEIVYAYDSNEGTSLLIAPGRKKVKEELETLLLFRLLRLEWTPPKKPSFDLSALLRSNFYLPPEQKELVEATVTRVHLTSEKRSGCQLYAKEGMTIQQAIDEWVISSKMEDRSVTVDEVTIVFFFTNRQTGEKTSVETRIKGKDKIYYQTNNQRELFFIHQILRKGGVDLNDITDIGKNSIVSGQKQESASLSVATRELFQPDQNGRTRNDPSSTVKHLL